MFKEVYIMCTNNLDKNNLEMYCDNKPVNDEVTANTPIVCPV